MATWNSIAPLVALVAIHVVLALAAYIPFAAGEMVVCVGAFAGVGALTAAAVAGTNSFFVAMLAGAMGGTLAGAVVALLALRLSGLRFTVATIAVGELARIVAYNAESMGGALGVRAQVPLPSYAWPIAVAVLAILGVARFEFSDARRALAAVRESPVLAGSLGIESKFVKVIAVIACGFLSGLGGALYVHTIGLYEARLFGFEYGVTVLAFCFIGGSANLWGPLAGAIGLTLIPEVLRFAEAWRMVLYGTLLVATAVLRPRGIVAAALSGFGARRFFRGRAGYTT